MNEPQMLRIKEVFGERVHKFT